jgi:CubicO group peptidase (beta-lactamase class C family)
MVKKLIIFLLLSTASICSADYELRLNDGVTLTWREYSIEGNQYCTRKELGKFCIQKSDVVALKEIVDGTGAAPQTHTTNVSVSTKPVSLKTVGGIPVVGRDAPGVDLFDEVMLNAMKRINCTSAVMAVADHGTVVYSRGYGWMDKEKKVPTQPNTMIGIASCEKPVTAASIRKLARAGRLSLDAKLFEFLRIKPQGQVVDDRMMKITINHLLEHKAGWGVDPVSEAAEAAKKMGFKNAVPVEARAWNPVSPGSADVFKDPIPIETLLGFIMTQRLKNEPGVKSEYCNFGFDALRHVITKVTGRPYIEYFQQELFRPEVVREFKAHDLPRKKGDSPLVWNAETGGLSASAPALLTFMRSYWLTGEPRDSGNPLWVMYGSLDGSTAIMVWRPDGIDLVALFNGRGSVTHDEISRALQAVIERLKENQGGSLQ